MPVTSSNRFLMPSSMGSSSELNASLLLSLLPVTDSSTNVSSHSPSVRISNPCSVSALLKSLCFKRLDPCL
eukprot:Gb_16035 [translate_table: standard]